MNEAEMQAMCHQAVERILRIPFSDWMDPEVLAGVLYEEFAPHCGLIDEAAGREVQT